jgi:CheY-like chemotaxis protein
LIVDDEPLLARSLSRLLGDEHDVVAVSSGVAALQLLRAGERFDVLLCDLRMPGMSGIELYERVGQSMPEVTERMVFFTGAAFSSDVHTFLRSVRNEHLEKPFDPPALRALVRRFVTRNASLSG